MYRGDINKLMQQYPLQLGINNPILRLQTEVVTAFDRDLHDFCLTLQELCWAYEGVWLAAPQIWVNKQICFITQRNTKSKKRQLEEEIIMINPKVVWMHEHSEIEEEACLSLPWVKGKVARPIAIKVTYQDVRWKQKNLQARGFNARVILHEFDHLQGILFVDKTV